MSCRLGPGSTHVCPSLKTKVGVSGERCNRIGGAPVNVLASGKRVDRFIVDNKTADMAASEEALEKTGATVTVAFYSVDEASIFFIG